MNFFIFFKKKEEKEENKFGLANFLFDMIVTIEYIQFIWNE